MWTVKSLRRTSAQTRKIFDYKLLGETDAPDGRLILVTAITPTPAGEGKTTTSVGLADGLRKIGKKATAALRESSLDPVFGVKGGAAVRRSAPVRGGRDHHVSPVPCCRF